MFFLDSIPIKVNRERLYNAKTRKSPKVYVYRKKKMIEKREIIPYFDGHLA